MANENGAWALPRMSRRNLIRGLKSGRYVFRVVFWYVEQPTRHLTAHITSYRLGPGHVLEKVVGRQQQYIYVRYDQLEQWKCVNGEISLVEKRSGSIDPIHLNDLHGYSRSTCTFSRRKAIRLAKLYTTTPSSEVGLIETF